MLDGITLGNFKSFNEVAVLPLAPLTMLLGANASGKSNLLEGMRLLSWLAEENSLAAIQTAISSEQIIRGRLEDLGYCQSPQFTLGCKGSYQQGTIELTTTLAGSYNRGLHIVGEEMSDSAENLPLYRVIDSAIGAGTDLTVEYNNFAKGGNKPRIYCSNQFAVFTRLVTRTNFSRSHKRSREIIANRCRQLKEWLVDILFIDPKPSNMRGYSFPHDTKKLNPDGSNLSGIIHQLWQSEQTGEAARREIILDFIRSLPEQEIAQIEFITTPRGEVMIQLVETVGQTRRRYDATLLSDGTLRVLAIAAALLSVPEGGVVVIEEIDNGIHPSRAAHLLEQVNRVAEQRRLRVVLSTHNPALVDALPPAALPDVVFCYRSPQDGASRLVRLQELPNYVELVVRGSLGQLLTQGVVDNLAKHPVTKTEKVRIAEEWLDKIRAATVES